MTVFIREHRQTAWPPCHAGFVRIVGIAASEQNAARVGHVVAWHAAAREQGHGVPAVHGKQQVALHEFRVKIHAVMVGGQGMEVFFQLATERRACLSREKPCAFFHSQIDQISAILQGMLEGLRVSCEGCGIGGEGQRRPRLERLHGGGNEAAKAVARRAHALFSRVSRVFSTGATRTRKSREIAASPPPAHRAALSTLMTASAPPTQIGPSTCPIR